jgi:hypothetical protein
MESNRTEDNGKQQNRRQWKATEQKTMESNRTEDNGKQQNRRQWISNRTEDNGYPTEQKTIESKQNRRQLKATGDTEQSLDTLLSTVPSYP